MRTHCRKGHELVGDNLYICKDNSHQCKICLAEYQRERRKLNPSVSLRAVEKYNANNPDKTRVQAHARYHKAKLKKSNCEHCGSDINLQMHHADYDKPLEVITLCVKCRNKEHIRLRKEYHND